MSAPVPAQLLVPAQFEAQALFMLDVERKRLAEENARWIETEKKRMEEELTVKMQLAFTKQQMDLVRTEALYTNIYA